MERGSSFAQALNQRHKALDLTQQQLAEQVGYAAVTIQRLEQSTLRPSRQVTERLAAILELPEGEREYFVRLARGRATWSPRSQPTRSAWRSTGNLGIARRSPMLSTTSGCCSRCGATTGVPDRF